MKDTKEVYHIYAVPFTARAAKDTDGAAYRHMTPDYILLYLPDGEALPRGAELVDGAELARLTADEKLWLMRCNVDILLSRMETDEQNISSKMDDFLTRFEAELEKERKRTPGEDGGE